MALHLPGLGLLPKRTAATNTPAATPAADTPSAIQRVFEVYELVEHILLDLGSMHDIARARRINRTTFAVTKDAPRVKKILWLEGVPSASPFHNFISGRFSLQVHPAFFRYITPNEALMPYITIECKETRKGLGEIQPLPPFRYEVHPILGEGAFEFELAANRSSTAFQFLEWRQVMQQERANVAIFNPQPRMNNITVRYSALAYRITVQGQREQGRVYVCRFLRIGQATLRQMLLAVQYLQAQDTVTPAEVIEWQLMEKEFNWKAPTTCFGNDRDLQEVHAMRVGEMYYVARFEALENR